MTEQSSKATVLRKVFQLLVGNAGLSPEEIAGLRLAHVHLAGKNPYLSITTPGGKEARKVDLDLDLHRAMVSWLVARPDSTGDFLFPGDDTEMMDPAEVRRLAPPAEKTAGPSRPVTREPDVEATRPHPSRSVPLPSTPEMGTPPPGMGFPGGASFRPGPPSRPPEADETMVSPGRATGPFSPTPPPPLPPEADETVSIPLPTSAPKPPARPSVPVGPVSPEAGEAPPRPEAETPAGSAAEGPPQPPGERPAPPPATETPQPRKRPDRPAALEKTQAGPVKPAVKAQTGSVTPPLKPASASGPVRPAPTGRPVKGETETPAGTGPGKPSAREAAAEQPASMPRFILPAVGGVVLLLCLACLGGGWFVFQSQPGSQFLASLGLGSGEPPLEEEIVEIPKAVVFESPVDSPLPTPTLPPTSTPTSLAPTNTPVPPTDTPTPIPTDTPALPPTDTPMPTDTPTPTSTPRPAQPDVTPTPADTPTPSMKFGAPVLVDPADEYPFIFGNTIVLRWDPVDLAADEQYAVRLIYRYNNEVVYQGAQVKEPEWIVPLSLYGQIDGADRIYEWFVVIERLNDDGSGTAISPESEHRTFSWK